MDQDTKEVLTDSEKLRGLTEHQGWCIARAKIIDTITELSNIANIDLTSPEKMMVEIAANKKATTILFAWLADIEGTVTQAKENISLPARNNSYIVRED